MKWSSSPPDREGNYWRRFSKLDIPHIVRIFYVDSELFYDNGSYDGPLTDFVEWSDDGLQWAGPLQEPEEDN